jgi:subtilisin family serine protease
VPALLQRVALPAQEQRVDPQIGRDVLQTRDGRTEFLVYLKEQPDLSAAYAIDDWQERGQFVYDQLHANAEQSQHDLRRWLDARGIDYTPLWIVNAIVVNGTTADVQALAARADVALLRANYPASIEIDRAIWPAFLSRLQSPLPQTDATIEWNIQRVQANRVWSDFGITGAGITVANIDTGVDYNHPALAEQYRGYRSENDIQHEYNWFDANYAIEIPRDTSSHGSHVMGTIVGRGNDTPDQPAVGVAPGASWIAALGCPFRSCYESTLIESAQWLLAPTDAEGKNPRPDLRPHIINNSWATSSGNSFYEGYTTAWRAAGIFAVFSSGNRGTYLCATVASPADYANVVAVGSTTSTDELSSFSGIGPGPGGILKPDLTAPGSNILSTIGSNNYGTMNGTSMAAPHVAGAVALLWSANPELIGDYDTTYRLLVETAQPRIDDTFSGDQYAACHADSVPNNIYGYGLLDTYAAIAEARVDIPWLALPEYFDPVAAGDTVTISIPVDARAIATPGSYNARILVGTNDLSQTPLAVEVALTVTSSPDLATVVGTVRDGFTDAPLVGTVKVNNHLRLTLDEEGSFRTLLQPGQTPYVFQTSIPGYINQNERMLLEAGGEYTLDFALDGDKPMLELVQPLGPGSSDPPAITATLEFGEQNGYRIDVQNSGSQPLDFTATVPFETYSIWRSDEPGGPESQWINAPMGSTNPITLNRGSTFGPIELDSPFVFNGIAREEVYVSASGILSFEEPSFTTIQPQSCLPAKEFLHEAIVPFRAELDPEAGGNVYWAVVEEGFLITFENVPVSKENSVYLDPDVTFQVLLANDGRVVFNYGQLDYLPSTLAVGIQHTWIHLQIVGCGKNAPLSSNMSVEFRPQINAQQWISLSGDTDAVALQPGEQVSMWIDVHAISTGRYQPHRSAVVVTSNDLHHPVVRMPVTLTTSTPPPYSIWLPLSVRLP